jgi:hypothetical protein
VHDFGRFTFRTVFRPSGFGVGVGSKGRVWWKFGSWGGRGTFCRIAVGAFDVIAQDAS